MGQPTSTPKSAVVIEPDPNTVIIKKIENGYTVKIKGKLFAYVTLSETLQATAAHFS